MTPWLAIGHRTFITADVGGQFTTDKALDTRLLYGTASVEYRSAGTRGAWAFGLSLGGGIDVGAWIVDSG